MTVLPKTRTPRSRRKRLLTLRLFLLKAGNLGVDEAYLIGSMATGDDNAFSDVDLCLKGEFNIETLYNLRDSIYNRTGVIIQMSVDEPHAPRKRVL